ncbi:MAG TPA: hypothetical protein VGJ15_11610 [Pirellulales bacterium]
MARSLKLGKWKLLLLAAASCGCLSLTGCTGTYSGQNLPSGYYLNQQLQYFPPGPEFKLSREAAAQKEYKESQEQTQGAPQ